MIVLIHSHYFVEMLIDIRRMRIYIKNVLKSFFDNGADNHCCDLLPPSLGGVKIVKNRSEKCHIETEMVYAVP